MPSRIAHRMADRRPNDAARLVSARGLVAIVGAAVACGTVPDDAGARIVPPSGVIRGTVVYSGPRPCSTGGHIVGSAIVLVFDSGNRPAPDGLAASAVNFAAVSGDVLFANEPRYTGSDTYCPQRAGFTETISASAPFDVAPMRAGGTYEIRALYDRKGHFLPEFQIRNLPEQGDAVGGYVDTAGALDPTNAGNPNYRPRFLPVVVGIPQRGASGETVYVLPPSGFVADNVTVTIGAILPGPRPYFFPQGNEVAYDPGAMGLVSSVSQSSDQPATDATGIAGTTATDPDAMPILTIPQDIEVLAPPVSPSPASVSYYESSFPHLLLPWGLPAAELATASAVPFDLPVAAFGQGPDGGGFSVWQNALLDAPTRTYVPQQIPEGGEPQLWPEVFLTKLPEGTSAAPQPLVLLQGITLLGGVGSDSLLGTAMAAGNGLLFGPAGGSPRPVVFAQDHLAVVLRPSVICLPSPPHPGILVTPHPLAATADVDCSTGSCTPSGTPGQPIAPPDLVGKAELAGLVAGSPVAGCLPTGRYAIHVVYPDGQAWTVPNEAGICSASEGSARAGACTTKRRPVLHSQGSRAVVEIVAAHDPAYCTAYPVPAACMPNP